MRRALLLVFSLLVMPAYASPDKLLGEYFSALAADDFSGVGKSILPDHLLEVKQMMVELIESESPAARSMETHFFGADVDVSIAKGKSGEFYVEQLLSLLSSEAGHMNFSIGNHKIIGEVAESRRQRHILVRLEVNQGEKIRSSITVYSFSKQSGQWYMEYPPTLKAYLDLIERDMALYR
jgi:hypothetical protein